METSFDDSDGTEIRNLKNQLTDFGVDEENLSKEEMIDLLKALNNSKTCIEEKENVQKKIENSPSPKKTMKRRYLNVRDRRMPWSLFPNSLTQAEKACTLAVYIKFMSINNYRQARQTPNFTTWPPPIQIVEETTRVQPTRSTRSGRSVPVYSGFDDDSNDLDFVVNKPKRRKVSNSENSDGIHSNKTLSLKRKTNKDDNSRPMKEQKVVMTDIVDTTSENGIKAKREIISLIGEE